jgi:protein-S-isoprenylcysteine O-methyltransferase Ste14
MTGNDNTRPLLDNETDDEEATAPTKDDNAVVTKKKNLRSGSVDDDKDDPLEKPFTKHELVGLFFSSLLLPWLVWGPFLWVGAYLRTYPALPVLWPGFWYTNTTFTTSYILLITLLRNYPRIVRIRMHKVVPNNDDSTREQEFARLGFAIGIPGLLLIPYDAVGRAERFPLLLNKIGSVCILISILWTAIVFRQNKYASRVVFQQPNQKLVTTGLYGSVRHPMYLGIIPMFLGLPLCCGSYWGLLPMALTILLAAYRTYSEEDFLVRNVKCNDCFSGKKTETKS